MNKKSGIYDFIRSVSEPEYNFRETNISTDITDALEEWKDGNEKRDYKILNDDCDGMPSAVRVKLFWEEEDRMTGGNDLSSVCRKFGLTTTDAVAFSITTP